MPKVLWESGNATETGCTETGLRRLLIGRSTQEYRFNSRGLRLVGTVGQYRSKLALMLLFDAETLYDLLCLFVDFNILRNVQQFRSLVEK